MAGRRRHIPYESMRLAIIVKHSEKGYLEATLSFWFNANEYATSPATAAKFFKKLAQHIYGSARTKRSGEEQMVFQDYVSTLNRRLTLLSMPDYLSAVLSMFTPLDTKLSTRVYSLADRRR